MRQNLQALAAAAFFFGIAASLPDDTKSAAAPTATEPRTAATMLSPAAPAARAVLSGVGIAKIGAEKPAATVAENSQVATALGVLAGSVKKQSHPDALRQAFAAYYNYKNEHPEKATKPYLYFVDYGLDSRTPRGYVFDMKSLRVVDGPCTVATVGAVSPPSFSIPTPLSTARAAGAAGESTDAALIGAVAVGAAALFESSGSEAAMPKKNAAAARAWRFWRMAILTFRSALHEPGAGKRMGSTGVQNMPGEPS